MSLRIEDFINNQEQWLNYAYAICKNSDYANDLVQELYMKLLQIQKEKGDLNHLAYNNKPNRAWVFVTMRNIFIDEHRKSKNLIPIKNTEIAEIESDIVLDEKVNALYEAIRELNQTDAGNYEFQHLAYYVANDLSLRQFAELKKSTVRIIQNAINNAKEKLREGVNRRTNN